jgi:hypothetical protein
MTTQQRREMLHCKSFAIVLIWRRLSICFGAFAGLFLVMHNKGGPGE